MADVALGHADHQPAVGLDHPPPGLLSQGYGRVQLVLLIGCQIRRASLLAASLFAGHHAAGEHLLLFSGQERMRAHLSEVQIDCVSS